MRKPRPVDGRDHEVKMCTGVGRRRHYRDPAIFTYSDRIMYFNKLLFLVHLVYSLCTNKRSELDSFEPLSKVDELDKSRLQSLDLTTGKELGSTTHQSS